MLVYRYPTFIKNDSTLLSKKIDTENCMIHFSKYKSIPCILIGCYQK